MFLAGFISSVCVASTCSTSEVPIPKASAPIAPCVLVWLSPQTMRHAGQRDALLRPDDVHDALARIEHREIRDAELGHVPLERLHLNAALLLLDAFAAVGGRDVVVDDGDGRVRPAHLAAGQCEALRKPAGWSPHARGAGRCRGRRCRPPSYRPRGCPTACRTASSPSVFASAYSAAAFAGCPCTSRARSAMRADLPLRPRR